MADIAASVLARLKNKAAESGRSYQLCLQLFCQEEFLRQLEKSKYAKNLVLKGGLFIYSLTDLMPETGTAKMHRLCVSSRRWPWVNRVAKQPLH